VRTTSVTDDIPASDRAPRRLSRSLLLVGLVIMLAGLLFGYDQGVISGALTGIEHRFSVGTFLLEIITSWVTLGNMAGALIAGAIAEVTFVYVRWFVPETKGRSLEDIQAMWGDRRALHEAIHATT
jgi:MFS family permease